MGEANATFTYRTLFISDVHLGSRFCDATTFVDFLARNSASIVFLVGDTFDFWSLGGRARWGDPHGQVLRSLCAMMQNGTRIIVIPGNHDDHLRSFLGFEVGGIEVHPYCVHETVKGQRFLVAHGDEHDRFVQKSGRFARVACRWKERLAPSPHLLRRLSGRGRHPKRTTTTSLWARFRYHFTDIGNVERALAADAAQQRLDGVISGHTHLPADRMVGGVRYLNCGDWVRNCTAIGEGWDGEIGLIRWTPSTAHRAAQRNVGANLHGAPINAVAAS